jgi:predicted RecB family endonuclease
MANLLDLGIALAFVGVLIAFTMLLLWRAYQGTPVNKAEEQIFTLGIALGGVAMFFGLQNVGVGNFRESLSVVVHHLVGAVAVNVAAMFCKMIYTYFSTTKVVVQKSNEVSSLDDLANVLRVNQKNQDENTARLIAALESNQTKMDVNFMKLDTTLNSFVRDLADRLVKQIEEVIVTLNDKLTVQLGDNFKRLNDAVNNLVIWQSLNKQAVSELERSAQALTSAATQTTSFTDSANRLESLIQSLSSQYEVMVRAQLQMESSLKSLADMPRIVGDKLNEMVTTVSSSAREMTTSGSQLTSTIQNNAYQVVELSKNLNQEMTNTERKFGEILNGSVQTFGQNVDRHAQALYEKLSNSTRELDNHLRTSSGQFENTLRQNQDQLHRTLEKSQQEYAQQLIASAQKIEEHTYQIEKAVEEELDRTIRIFAEKVVNILTYAVQTAQSAYGMANEAKDEVKNGRV